MMNMKLLRSFCDPNYFILQTGCSYGAKQKMFLISEGALYHNRTKTVSKPYTFKIHLCLTVCKSKEIFIGIIHVN